MQIPVLLDRSASAGLVSQIAAQLREGIRIGRIPDGARLPSSRRFAEQLEVSRNTVVRAYEILESEGYVEARAASGVFAVADPARTAPPPVQVLPQPMAGPGMPPPRRAPRAQQLTGPAGTRISVDFSPGRPAPGLFPLKNWRRLLHATLSHGSQSGLAGYSDPGGLFALRSAIAGHLALSRGVVADPNQIVITGGTQEGLSIAAGLFLGPDRQAVIENPCYQGATYAFEATGANILRVPVDQDGLNPAKLPREPASLIYTTPSHQYPIGATLTLDRRMVLIDWARTTGCYILEDDYDGDFRYQGSPLPAIAAMAPDCTIHLGTFSKTLGAGLRLGYMVVPPDLIEPVRNAKALLNNGNSWLEQAAMAEFIRGGSFAAHVQRCRTQYRKNRDALLNALHRCFGEVEYSGAAAGLHILWQLPPGVPSARPLEALARRARIGVSSLANGGAHDALDTGLEDSALILGFASSTPKQIEQGIARLSDVIDDTLDTRPGFVDDLLTGAPVPIVRHDQPVPRLRNKPALHAAMPHDAPSAPEHDEERSQSMQILRGIYRYPVKGLSPQPVTGVTLEAGKPFPFDRIFALARPGVPIDPDAPKWAKKGLFVMLMLDEDLARVRTDLDIETMVLSVSRDDETLLLADLTSASDRAAVEHFFGDLVPRLTGTPRLVQSRGAHFMDKPDNVLSLMNLATLRSLEAEWGVPLNPLRFRANFYVDGLEPWQEFDWVNSDIRIGDAVFRADRRNGRCGATNVNPDTGARDLDIPATLRKAFRHKDLGIYLLTKQGGKVVVGDPVSGPKGMGETRPASTPALAVPAAEAQRHICRGCYYIHDSHGSSGFDTLPVDWRCPDCGGEKTGFRVYANV